MSEIASEFIMFLLLISPVIFLVGLVTLIVSKERKRYGLWLILASIIIFIIGFGACLSNFSI